MATSTLLHRCFPECLKVNLYQYFNHFINKKSEKDLIKFCKGVVVVLPPKVTTPPIDVNCSCVLQMMQIFEALFYEINCGFNYPKNVLLLGCKKVV